MKVSKCNLLLQKVGALHLHPRPDSAVDLRAGPGPPALAGTAASTPSWFHPSPGWVAEGSVPMHCCWPSLTRLPS